LRNAIESEHAAARRNFVKEYETFGHLVNARVKVTSTYPGSQYITQEAAQLLIARLYMIIYGTIHYCDQLLY
jgi:hypothetical protein